MVFNINGGGTFTYRTNKVNRENRRKLGQVTDTTHYLKYGKRRKETDIGNIIISNHKDYYFFTQELINASLQQQSGSNLYGTNLYLRLNFYSGGHCSHSLQIHTLTNSLIKEISGWILK